MKKHISIALFCAAASGLFAQNAAKKYLLLEHFTNSRCSICASKNPAFYATIGQFPSDIHHLSIHPPVPYVNCAIYQSNKADNEARANIYGISGTPTLALNGQELPPASPLISAATIQANLNKTSPLYLKVSQSGAGSQRTASIEAHSLSDIPAGNYRLFAAVVEKTYNYPAPNGETVHRDVLRKLLPTAQGEPFSPAAAGSKVDFSYTFALDPAWSAGEIYVLVFVQNMDTKEVLNSGTPFDPPLVSKATEVAENQNIVLAPNPIGDRLSVQMRDGEALVSVDVFAADGRLAERFGGLSGSTADLDFSRLAPGAYFLKITGARGVYRKPALKN